jgi:predicted SnoaL-like aldol condensation-catalyzing enzyme
MSLQGNKDVVRRFIQEVMNEGRFDALEDYLSADFVNHVTGQSGIPAYRSVVEWARRLQGEGGTNVIDELIAEDDRVSVFITVKGRLSSEVQLFGITFPASGATFANKHVHTFRIRDGKLAEHWAIRDDLTMLLQLGARVAGPEATR